jgi:hypothetical protein
MSRHGCGKKRGGRERDKCTERVKERKKMVRDEDTKEVIAR